MQSVERRPVSSTVEEPSEVDLVRRSRDGDEGAFRFLLERHHDRVYRTAYAVTADAAAAAEVAQDAWVRAWRGLGGFRGAAAFSTWVTRLAVNAANDYLRRQRRRERIEGLFGVFGSRGRAPEDALADRDELRGALAGLSAPLREVVALRYGLDLTVPAIAETLGCPEGTVKSRLHAALAQLRRTLSEEVDRG
jgi:RNA polymerase sigma-70 factor (ECF subfamily)